MVEQGIKFDAGDPILMAFWKDLGVPDNAANDGFLSALELYNLGLRFDSLSIISRTDPLREDEEKYGSCHLSQREVIRFYSLTESAGWQNVIPLFRKNIFPGKCERSQAIVGNFLGVNSEVRNIFGGSVFEEDSCSFEDLIPYGHENLKGIHFTEEMMPEDLVENAGTAVLPVKFRNGEHESKGSAVVISGNGDVLMARHELRSNTYEIHGNLTITDGDRTIHVGEEHIAWEHDWSDIVHLRIPELGKHAFLPPASHLPEKGAEVFYIGYPLVFHMFRPVDVKLFTTGEVTKAGPDRIVSSARNAFGYSGGAMVTIEDGAPVLAGIISSVKMNRITMSAHESYAVPLYHLYMDYVPPKKVPLKGAAAAFEELDMYADFTNE